MSSTESKASKVYHLLAFKRAFSFQLSSVNSAVCRPLLDWQLLKPETKFGLLTDKVGGMTSWKQISQAFPLLPSPSFPPYFFPLSYFAPHSTIRTPGTGFKEAKYKNTKTEIQNQKWSPLKLRITYVSFCGIPQRGGVGGYKKPKNRLIFVCPQRTKPQNRRFSVQKPKNRPKNGQNRKSQPPLSKPVTHWLV